ncbi:glycosyltransferase, putative [Enterococcus casseliflavus]|uniref:glycosyltransferase n=1 Tax=Enterococcus casseliflavus TaxID=37734 RepID=UPI000E041A6E|nr:glycosyltransferase [Enterococcus casseliflavus]GEB27116.1 glycosyl transferase [Enterococcus casseliflavus]STP34211.1 glycosyltransferase, putative [Enterococcus casseliflavus]
MKVLILNEHFGMGGLERVSTVIGRALSEYYDVYYYAFSLDNNFYELNENYVYPTKKQRNKWLNINHYKKGLDFLFTNKIEPYKYIRRDLQKLVDWINYNHIDVTIVSSPRLISCIQYLQKYTDSKYIAWLHNNYETYMFNYTKRYNDAFRRSLCHADKVVSLTYSDETKYKKINSNTVCIYNPLTLTHERRSELTAKNISFTGRLSYEHKGIDYLVEVAKEIPNDWTITIAGNGSIDEIRKLDKLIEYHKLEKKLLFKGPLEGDDLLSHYENSSIYLMTSRWEGMPLVLAEAMSFGLPIVAFEQSGSNEVLQSGKYGMIVELGNICAMTESINKLIKNKHVLEKYQELSLQRIADFDLSRITKQWLTIITESLGEKN